jgi:type I restriction enzyme S subunit
MSSNLRSLNEIISFRGGGTPKKDIAEYWSDEIPWASVKDFKSLDLSRTQDSISRKGLEKSSANLIPAGHVIIPTRMALGKAAINSIDLAINQDLRALIPKVPIHSRYLLHSMIGLAGEIERYGSGATVKGITQDNLGKLQIPLPPLDEQKRVAAILDAADALRAKRRQSIAQLDALIQSTFLDLFGDPVTNPMGWEIVLLGQQTTKLGSGSTPTGGSDAYKNEGLSLIRSLNVRDGEFTYKDLALIDDKQAAKLSNVVVEENDVLLNITGASVARVCRAPKSVLPARVNQHVCIIRPKPSINPLFLEHLLLTPQTKNKLLRIGGAGATREAITKAQLEQFEVVCPPLPLQQKFAVIVESIERQKTTQRAHLAELDALFAALQHRAFRGEV